MMRTVSYTAQFKRDVKRMQKRGKDMEKLKDVITLLASGKSLPRELSDHSLKGEWKNSRDLHLEPDWVLIYYVEKDSLRLDRTGSYADVFAR